MLRRHLEVCECTDAVSQYDWGKLACQWSVYASLPVHVVIGVCQHALEEVQCKFYMGRNLAFLKSGNNRRCDSVQHGWHEFLQHAKVKKHNKQLFEGIFIQIWKNTLFSLSNMVESYKGGNRAFYLSNTTRRSAQDGQNSGGPRTYHQNHTWSHFFGPSIWFPSKWFCSKESWYVYMWL